ncbi:MAG: C40 family peptidase [Desulfomonile tiedjei]|nr:C40 family peptidase [Desulfomonile tiedjei]
MIRKLVAISWLLLCWLSALSFAGPDAWGLADPYKRSLKGQLQFIIAKHPKYTWGGSSDLEQGLDCSGYLFLAAKWAGIPGITRTTSDRMADGLGGWTSKEIDLKDARECDLPFWTFRPARKNGHVGAFLNDNRGRRAVTHAGMSKGVVLEPLNGKLLENLSKVRRLTIGD